MITIKDFAMPSKCSKCIFEAYDWETGEHSCKICNAVTENERKARRSERCPLIECESKCDQAEKIGNKECLGYQRSEDDDEPAERCKECEKHYMYEMK
jgi:hypothetical protein